MSLNVIMYQEGLLTRPWEQTVQSNCGDMWIGGEGGDDWLFCLIRDLCYGTEYLIIHLLAS